MKNTILIISIALNIYSFYLLNNKVKNEYIKNNVLTIKDSINDNYTRKKDSIIIKVDSMAIDSVYYNLINVIEQRMRNDGTVVK